jgi:hypothetical protein
VPIEHAVLGPDINEIVFTLLGIEIRDSLVVELLPRASVQIELLALAMIEPVEEVLRGL